MSFAWPTMLILLLLLPILVVAYLQLTAYRDASTARHGAMRLAEGASRRGVGRRRHLPPAIFLVAIALLLASLARPTAVVALPHREGTVILAFDVSTSMRAGDLEPSRMEAAKQAAAEFARNQPSTIELGVVAFSDSALTIQQPTGVQDDVLAAIDRIAAQGGTSLSEGLLAALGAIAGRPIGIAPGASPDQPPVLPSDIGYFGSAVIVLLSDGENTSEPDPLAVAALAAGAGVRVYTIGIGSPEGTTLEIDGYRVATALNEPLLTDIAAVTDGAYFRAEDEAKLVEVYDAIELRLAISGEEMEVTALLAGAAMVLLVVGATLTTRWFGRVP